MFLSALQFGTPLTLAFVGVILWSLLAAGREYFHLRKLKKRLEAGELLEQKTNWQKKRRWYWGLEGARWALGLCVLGLIVHAWAVWDEGEIPMVEYSGTPPIDVDWAVAYRLIYPAVVFQKGNVVVRVRINRDVQFLKDWAPKLADSIS